MIVDKYLITASDNERLHIESAVVGEKEVDEGGCRLTEGETFAREIIWG